MSFEKIAHNIKKAQNGIYYSESESHVSYPEEGNEDCLQIEEDSFWFNHRNNIIANTVRKHSPNKTFFDIGGGNGFVAKRLQNDGIKTILVEPGNISSLHNAIKKIFETPCTRPRMSKACKEEYTKNFTVDKMFSSFKSLYIETQTK